MEVPAGTRGPCSCRHRILNSYTCVSRPLPGSLHFMPPKTPQDASAVLTSYGGVTKVRGWRPTNSDPRQTEPVHLAVGPQLSTPALPQEGQPWAEADSGGRIRCGPAVPAAGKLIRSGWWLRGAGGVCQPQPLIVCECTLTRAPSTSCRCRRAQPGLLPTARWVQGEMKVWQNVGVTPDRQAATCLPSEPGEATNQDPGLQPSVGVNCCPKVRESQRPGCLAQASDAKGITDTAGRGRAGQEGAPVPHGNLALPARLRLKFPFPLFPVVETGNPRSESRHLHSLLLDRGPWRSPRQPLPATLILSNLGTYGSAPPPRCGVRPTTRTSQRKLGPQGPNR